MASQKMPSVPVNVSDIMERIVTKKLQISSGWRSESTVLSIVRFYSQRYAPLSLRHFTQERYAQSRVLENCNHYNSKNH